MTIRCPDSCGCLCVFDTIADILVLCRIGHEQGHRFLRVAIAKQAQGSSSLLMRIAIRGDINNINVCVGVLEQEADC